MAKHGARSEPCSGCPWRKDTSMSIFRVAEEMCGSPSRPIMPHQPMMPCHKDPQDPELDQELCAGWLATFGNDHLGVRMMVADGTIPASSLLPAEGWPELHESVQSIIETHGGEDA